MEQKKNSLLQVHLAVLLFGLSGLFGKLLPQPALVITLGRAVFSSLALLGLIRLRRIPLAVGGGRSLAALLALGAVLALHWCSFYQAIQLSTVAVGLLTFSSFPIFVTFLEPLFFHRRLLGRDVLLAALTFGGILLVVPLDGGAATLQGAAWGLVSGLSYALLGLLNKKFVSRLPAPVISFYEQLAAAVLLLPALLWLRPSFTAEQGGLLALLGVVFTALSHTLFISGLRGVRTQTAGIISSLEPVYGIVFAALVLGEVPTPRAVAGGLVVLGCAFAASRGGGEEAST